jgi:hypothetical protein
MTRFECKLTTALLATMLIPGPYSMALAQKQATRPAKQVKRIASSPAKPAAEEEDENSSPSKPGVEGIKVHGHWILDLKDKDGKVLEHRDFHNSLTLSGGDTLAKLITGLAVGSALQIQAGGFIIYRGDIANHGLPSCNANPPNAACVPNLTVTYTRFDVPNNIPGSFVTLNGSITPTTATTVSSVTTSAMICQSPTIPVPSTLVTESPARCAANDLDSGLITSNGLFTSATITPINVAAGQTLAITVVLSFS